MNEDTTIDYELDNPYGSFDCAYVLSWNGQRRLVYPLQTSKMFLVVVDYKFKSFANSFPEALRYAQTYNCC